MDRNIGTLSVNTVVQYMDFIYNSYILKISLLFGRERQTFHFRLKLILDAPFEGKGNIGIYIHFYTRNTYK